MESKKRTLIVLASSSAVLSSVLIGMAGFWHAYRVAPFEPTLCYTTESVTNADSNPGVLKQLIVKNDKDTHREKICKKVSDSLDDIVTQKTEEKYNSDANPEHASFDLEGVNCRRIRSEGIKLNLRHIKSHAQPVEGKPTKVFWEPTSDSVEELKHLANEGAVYVQESGLYYVSTQLTTAVRNNTHSTNTHQTISHVVYRISHGKGTESIILESVKSTCELPVEMSELSSTMGAVFRLQESDIIYVATTHPYYMVTGPGRSYLSINMI